MEQAPETSSTGMSQGWALAIVAGVLVAVGLTWYLTGSSAEPTPTETPTPSDFSLTDEEAIARFKELDHLRVRAIDSRDASLLGAIFVSSSEIGRITERNIQRLARARVHAKHEPYETKSVRVIANSERVVRIEQVVEFDVRFEGSGGENLTEQGGLERQRIIWTLVRQADKWRIDAARVVSSKVL